MSLRLLRVFLFISFGVSYPHANADEARPPYKFLRYDEDYSFLSDPTQRTDLFDCVKYIPLDGAGYLSFGGEVRERFETYKNEEFSPNPNADNAYLSTALPFPRRLPSGRVAAGFRGIAKFTRRRQARRATADGS